MNTRPFSCHIGWLALIASLLFCDLGRFWLGAPLQTPYASQAPSGADREEDDALPLSQGNAFEEEVKHSLGSMDLSLLQMKGAIAQPRIARWIADEDVSPLTCRTVLVPPPDGY